jgi:hypothetical protein
MTVWLETKTPSGNRITINCDHIWYIEPEGPEQSRLYMGENIARFVQMPYEDVIANIRKVETRKTR